jgi:hypothetical protein
MVVGRYLYTTHYRAGGEWGEGDNDDVADCPIASAYQLESNRDEIKIPTSKKKTWTIQLFCWRENISLQEK